jgi:hypothetical protein
MKTLSTSDGAAAPSGSKLLALSYQLSPAGSEATVGHLHSLFTLSKNRPEAGCPAPAISWADRVSAYSLKLTA